MNISKKIVLAIFIIFLNSCMPDYLEYKEMIGYTTTVNGYDSNNDFYWKKEYEKYQYCKSNINFLEFNYNSAWQNEYISYIIYQDVEINNKCYIIKYDAIKETIAKSDFNDKFFEEFLKLNDCEKTIGNPSGHTDVLMYYHDNIIRIEYSIGEEKGQFSKNIIASNYFKECEQKQIEFLQDQLLYYYLIHH